MMISRMEINILIEDEFKQYLNAGWLENILARALSAQGEPDSSEISLLVTGQEKIHELNQRYLDEDRPTDVLSFSMRETPEGEGEIFIQPPDQAQHLGEIIISYPQAAIQAEEHRHDVKWEVAILIIHGVLHLLGFDHGELGREQEMHAREVAILNLIEEAGL
jgi:probable rRNA maturation factor